MAIFETVMDIGQKFWTIESTVRYRDKKRFCDRWIKEHEVEEIRIYDVDYIGYVYDIMHEECYSQFRKKDIGKSVFLTEEDAKLALALIEAAE